MLLFQQICVLVANLAAFRFRYNAFLYTPEGKEAADRLFEETMDELKFADVRGILESMKR